MKKILIVIIAIFLLVGCRQQTTDQEPQVQFKEPGIESEFMLPAGWTYKKEQFTTEEAPDFEGVEVFSISNAEKEKVGSITFYSENFGDTVETAVDNCWRAWNIYSGETNAGKKNFMVPEAPTFGLDHYIYVTSDNATSVATESCPGQAFIYWVPGVMITDMEDLIEYYQKKSMFRMVLRNSVLTDDNFLDLVHDIAKSVKIKNQN